MLEPKTEQYFEQELITSSIDVLQELRLEYIPNSKPWKVLEEAERLLALKRDSLCSS